MRKNNCKKTPQGTKDFLFEECLARQYTERKLEDLFIKRGYSRVMTPGTEYMDLFSLGSSGISPEDMFKFSDSNGSLIALRADATLPIARVVATRLQNTDDPKRLYYFHKIYRNNKAYTGKRNEIMQAGIEVLGIGGVKNDLEILITAYNTLKAFCSDFRIEISYAGLFKSLISRLNATDEVKEEIRLLTESKNYASLNMLLDDIQATDITKAIKLLPRLFGGEEVFDAAFNLIADDTFKSRLEYLRGIYKILSDSGFSDKFIIDLGLVHQNDYYSGIVFRGYISGVADTVLKGGRYDKLLNSFEISKPAIGFGVDVDILSKLMLENGQIPVRNNNTVLVHCDTGYETEMVKYAEKLYKNAESCEYSIFATIDEAKAYAENKGIKKIYYIKDTLSEINI